MLSIQHVKFIFDAFSTHLNWFHSMNFFFFSKSSIQNFESEHHVCYRYNSNLEYATVRNLGSLYSFFRSCDLNATPFFPQLINQANIIY